MSSQIVLAAIWMMSVALVLKLVNDWSQLPPRVAVHFGFEMQPNGWSSRNVLGAIILVAAIGEAAFASWLLLNLGPASTIAGPVLLGVSAVLVSVFWQIINYNTRGIPLRARWIVLPLLLMAAFGFLLSKSIR